MSKLTHLFCAATVLGLALPVCAEEYALSFKKIEPKQVMSFPGGYGAFGQHRLTKPSGLKKEPTAISKHVLYGEFQGYGQSNMVFRLDESQGDGKGYDRMVLDLNQNGDLSDDPAAERTEKRPSSSQMEIGIFGPFEASSTIAGGHPVYFVESYIFNLSAARSTNQNSDPYSIGQVRLRAGWYLETSITFQGQQQKIGIFDADSNVQLGDQPRSLSSGEDWYLGGGDSFLMDKNGSDKFESDMLSRETAPFGSILYIGSEPYKVALSKNCTSLLVEPWTEPLATVALQPAGDQVESVELGRNIKGDEWQMIKAGVTNGSMKVPPGDYRLFTCQLCVKNTNGESFAAMGRLTSAKKPFSYKLDKSNALQCGAPLKIKVEGKAKKPEPWELSRIPASKDPKEDSELVVSLNSTVMGQGGEVYSSYAKGKKLERNPNSPSVVLLDSKGAKLASGNMEFG